MALGAGGLSRCEISARPRPCLTQAGWPPILHQAFSCLFGVGISSWGAARVVALGLGALRVHAGTICHSCVSKCWRVGQGSCWSSAVTPFPLLLFLLFGETE